MVLFRQRPPSIPAFQTLGPPCSFLSRLVPLSWCSSGITHTPTLSPIHTCGWRPRSSSHPPTPATLLHNGASHGERGGRRSACWALHTHPSTRSTPTSSLTLLFLVLALARFGFRSSRPPRYSYVLVCHHPRPPTENRLCLAFYIHTNPHSKLARGAAVSLSQLSSPLAPNIHYCCSSPLTLSLSFTPTSSSCLRCAAATTSLSFPGPLTRPDICPSSSEYLLLGLFYLLLSSRMVPTRNNRICKGLSE